MSSERNIEQELRIDFEHEKCSTGLTFPHDPQKLRAAKRQVWKDGERYTGGWMADQFHGNGRPAHDPDTIVVLKGSRRPSLLTRPTSFQCLSLCLTHFSGFSVLLASSLEDRLRSKDVCAEKHCFWVRLGSHASRKFYPLFLHGATRFADVE